MNLPKFSVNNPVTTVMMALIIAVFGFISFGRLGLDMLPDIEFPTVSIVTSYIGVASEDIETVITKPIEDAVATVKDVKKVQSVSQEGSSVVTVEFNSGTNVDVAAQDLRDKLGMISGFLPQDAQDPMVLKMDVGAIPVLGFGVTSTSLSNAELKKLLEDFVKDKIERLDGVATLEIQGGQDREILIRLNKDLMDLHGFDQAQITQKLRSENVNLSGGYLEKGFLEMPLKTRGEFKSLEEIENIILAVKNNQPIYLRDVARIEDTFEEQRSFSRTNGKASLLIFINKQSDANTAKMAELSKEKLEELKASLPQDVEFSLVMDQSRQIQKATSSVSQSGLIGAFLAIAVLYLFLRSVGSTIAIAVAIPLSVVATFIPLYAFGYTFNMMTLGGLSLGIGMLVDNAVVVIENIYRHLEKTGKRKTSAILGAKEVGMAIVASTLTTVAVFIPMSMGSGIAGQLSRGLSLTIVFSLMASLFVALTIVPMIASKIFKNKKVSPAKPNERVDQLGLFEKIQNFYKKVLIWSLHHRKKVIGGSIGLLLGVVGLTFFIGAEFMPSVERSILMFEFKLPAGTSLAQTDKTSQMLEKIIMENVGDDMVSLTSFAGQNDSGAGMGGGVNEGMIMMNMKDKSERKLSAVEIEEIVRQNKPPIKGLEVNAVDMSAMMTGGTGNPIDLKIFGNDMETLEKTAEEIKEKIKEVQGLRDINISLDEGKPELTVAIDREKASFLGVSVGQVGTALKNGVLGEVATQFREKGEETDIRVRFEEEFRNNLEEIENLQVVSTTGEKVSLKQIVKISQVSGPIKINREDQLRVVSVTAGLVDRDAGSATADIQKALADYQPPAGYFIEYGGSFKQMQESFQTMAFALIIGILLVYMVMASQFESLVYPFVAMFEIPLAFIGVGLALFVTGQPLSLPAFMGVIMLAGIIVNNAIVLIDYVNQLRARGADVFEALIEGGVTRLRPILITSLTTVLGMLPMALSRQEGSEMMRPMAIAVIGGLVVSTFLTLVVIPVAYSLTDQIASKVKAKIKAKLAS